MNQTWWREQRIALAQRIGVDLEHPQRKYAAALAATLRPGDRWLDIGCGKQIVPAWAMAAEAQRALVARSACLVGIDADEALMAHPHLTYRVFALGNHMPFREQSFDLLTANMVMEHVDDPPSLLRQVYGLLRPGGAFLFHTPNYHYFLIFIASRVPQGLKNRIIKVLEEREEHDVFPTLYRINTEAAIRAHARVAGFEVERLDITGPYGSFGMLGPLGVMEVPLLKVFSFESMRRWRSNFIVRLRRLGG